MLDVNVKSFWNDTYVTESFAKFKQSDTSIFVANSHTVTLFLDSKRSQWRISYLYFFPGLNFVRKKQDSY